MGNARLTWAYPHFGLHEGVGIRVLPGEPRNTILFKHVLAVLVVPPIEAGCLVEAIVEPPRSFELLAAGGAVLRVVVHILGAELHVVVGGHSITWN